MIHRISQNKSLRTEVTAFISEYGETTEVHKGTRGEHAELNANIRFSGKQRAYITCSCDKEDYAPQVNTYAFIA
jgi:hypothetical protein